MNSLKKLIYLVPVALGMITASCSTIMPIIGGGSSSSSSESSSKKGSHRDVLPEDRQQFIIDKAAKAYTPDELGRGIIKGDWAIETVNGRQAAGLDKTPYVKFDLPSKRVFGNDGCNQFSGTYQYSAADRTIRFTDFLSTMMACDASVTDAEIKSAFDMVRYYSWELKGSQYYLYLENSVHETILVLMHQDFAFLNGTWLVKAIDDQPVAIPDLRFVIDVDEKKIHGNTGCNLLNGKLITEMDAANSISFQAIGVTQRYCPDVEYENDLIVALEDASTVRPISEDKVLLINNHGVVVLELERAADK